MQAIKELHLAEIGLISGGITKKQMLIAGAVIGAGALAAGALYLVTRNSQLARQAATASLNWEIIMQIHQEKMASYDRIFAEMDRCDQMIGPI